MSTARISARNIVMREAVREATRVGVPDWLAEDAARITLRRLGDLTGSSVTTRERMRVRAYFWGVIRKTCLESPDRALDPLRERYVQASIDADAQRARDQQVAAPGRSHEPPAEQLTLAVA